MSGARPCSGRAERKEVRGRLYGLRHASLGLATRSGLVAVPVAVVQDALDAADRGEDAETRVAKALAAIMRYGGIDGADHKQWVLDQVVRALAPDRAAWVAAFGEGEDGPSTYAWDEGVAP